MGIGTIAIVTVAAALSLSTQATDTLAPTVTGSWTLAVDGGAHGVVAMGLVLKHEGKTVTGTFASPHGESRVAGRFESGTLTLATTGGGDSVPQVTFNATLNDDGTLAGYLSSEMGDMKWTATRAKGEKG